MRKWTIVVLAMMLAGGALANTGAWLTGGELLRACDDKEDAYKQGLCTGYILGAADGTTIWELWMNLSSNICISKKVEIGRVVDVAVRNLRAHPEDLHFDASSLVLNALIKTYPCE